MSSTGDNLFAQLRKPGVIDLVRKELPRTLPAEYIRLKVAYCAICGGDIASYKGQANENFPFTIGHEYFGTITATASDVLEFNEGDSVAVDPNFRCGECDFCLSGMSNHCEKSGINLFEPRGLAHFVDIHCSYLHKIPSFKQDFLGALIEPLSCSLYAIDQAFIANSERILILGCGGQGTLLTFALTNRFPGVEIDLYDPNQAKVANLHDAFSLNTTLLDQPPPIPTYPLVFEASGQSKGFDYAAAAIAKGGQIVVISRYRKQKAHIPEELPRSGCQITFSHLNGNGEPFIRAIDLLASSWRKSYNRLIKIESFNDLANVFKGLDQSSYSKIVVKIN